MPGCDDETNPEYDSHWVTGAVPGKFDSNGNFNPEHCKMFESSYDDDEVVANCSSLSFLTNQTVTCDRWVYDKHEKTIVEEVSPIN